MSSSSPVALFAYARPDHLRRTLACLRENKVSLVYAFSDGPSTPDKAPVVAQVRDIMRAIDWCEVVLCEREANLGLGRSVLAGVTEVLGKHDSAIIVEDDLIFVPGTYDYLCAALEHYGDDPRVMSVTGWLDPLATPSDVIDRPYFDGRAECWVWGTWRRAWHGMRDDAATLVQKCRAERIDVYRYGADLPRMAAVELESNIWAVRFLYWHIINRGLCLRPPWSMVEHTGIGPGATNAGSVSCAGHAPLRSSPPIPQRWPEPMEHPACSRLWQEAYGGRPTVASRLCRFGRRAARGLLRVLSLK